MKLERKRSFYEKNIKRILDIICSFLTIVIFSWLYLFIVRSMIFTYICIRPTSTIAFSSYKRIHPVNRLHVHRLPYNYRMSNIIAGILRGQLPYLEEHIRSKRRIYERYREGLAELPVSMNPIDFSRSQPNYWLSCLLINSDVKEPRHYCRSRFYSHFRIRYFPSRTCRFVRPCMWLQKESNRLLAISA